MSCQSFTFLTEYLVMFSSPVAECSVECLFEFEAAELINLVFAFYVADIFVA